MTEEQTRLVKNSWKKLRNVNAVIIGDLFYTKLFFDYPRLRKMFPENMEQQNKKLIDMLTYIASNIDNFEAIENDIKKLGERHIAYGASSRHYQIIGANLIWTLEKAIGTDWDNQLKEAWLVCYDTVVKTMTGTAQNTA